LANLVRKVRDAEWLRMRGGLVGAIQIKDRLNRIVLRF
jgi:hypothetical protein